ncbi:hypothetical protein C4D27_17120 [Clostridium perfringens]
MKSKKIIMAVATGILLSGAILFGVKHAQSGKFPKEVSRKINDNIEIPKDEKEISYFTYLNKSFNDIEENISDSTKYMNKYIKDKDENGFKAYVSTLSKQERTLSDCLKRLDASKVVANIDLAFLADRIISDEKLLNEYKDYLNKVHDSNNINDEFINKMNEDINKFINNIEKDKALTNKLINVYRMDVGKSELPIDGFTKLQLNTFLINSMYHTTSLDRIYENDFKLFSELAKEFKDENTTYIVNPVDVCISHSDSYKSSKEISEYFSDLKEYSEAYNKYCDDVINNKSNDDLKKDFEFLKNKRAKLNSVYKIKHMLT